MQEYSKLLLTSAKTRTQVIQEQYPDNKYLGKITQRIIEDIKAAIVFDEMGEYTNKYNANTKKELEDFNAMKEVHYK